jgi:hypothetical protein
MEFFAPQEVTRTGGWSLGGAVRIQKCKRRICIVLEMRHLLGTKVEKAARLLLE